MNTMKAMLRERFIEARAYIKKLKKSHTSNLTEHLTALKQKQVSILKRQ